MDNQTMLLIRKTVEAKEDDVIIILHIRPEDIRRVTGALELAGITKQETNLVEA